LCRSRFSLPGEDFGTFDVSQRGEFYPIIDSKCGTLEEALTQVSLSERVVVLPALLSKHVTFPGVTYRPLAGRPIVKQTLMAFRCDEKSEAVQMFVEQALERSAPSHRNDDLSDALTPQDGGNDRDR
jgi:hypothetical protein